MKSVAAIGAAALLGAVSANTPEQIRSAFAGYHVVEVDYDHMSKETVDLLVGHEADHYGKNHFKITPEALKALENQNVNFKETTEDWINHFETNFADPNFTCKGAKCAERDMQSFYSSYQDLESLHARARSLVASSSENARIGSIGTTYEGRDQLTVEIGDGTKPLVFYFCNIHAREWLTPMYCMYMAEQLLAGHALLDTYDFTILISANADGYAYTWSTNSQWRKTRKPNPGSSCVGTDPNRNYDNHFCGEGTSTSPCSEVYCGSAPFSEKCVANIRDYGLANADRLVVMQDVHSYSELWMFPYGGISADTPDYDKQMKCSEAAVNAIFQSSGNRWDFGPVYSTIYPAAGTSVDWFYDTLGVVYAMTSELRGTSFQPSASNIIPSNLEMFAAMEAQLICVKAEEGLPGAEVPTAMPVPTPPPTPTCIFFC